MKDERRRHTRSAISSDVFFGRAASALALSHQRCDSVRCASRRAIRSITFALMASPFRATVVPLLSLSHSACFARGYAGIKYASIWYLIPEARSADT
jgi:hypothetical protein